MLRQYIFLPVVVICFFSIVSCEKQTPVRENFAVLQMFGWTPDFLPIVANFREAPLAKYSEAALLNSFLLGTYMNKYNITETSQPISFYAFPDTFPSSKPVLKLNLKLEMGQIYSMFLAGNASFLDTVLVKENFPLLKPADSVGAVRFVNLINDAPVSINVKDEPVGSVVENLPYMGVTDFGLYSAKKGRDMYQFEIRDAQTGDLLFTSDIADLLGDVNNRHHFYNKLRTHVLVGMRDGTGANSLSNYQFRHN